MSVCVSLENRKNKTKENKAETTSLLALSIHKPVRFTFVHTQIFVSVTFSHINVDITKKGSFEKEKKNSVIKKDKKRTI